MKKISLMRWIDTSDDLFRSVKVFFVNGLQMNISQPQDLDDELKYLWIVSVFDREGHSVKNYLDACDVYADELEEDFTCLLLVSQIEYYVKKLSTLIL